LKTPTLAILAHDGKTIPVTIPKRGTVEVEVELNGHRPVAVRWEGTIVMIFATDLRERGEVVIAKAVTA